MILVLFEVYVKEDKMKDYRKLSASLEELYRDSNGFISRESFVSSSENDKLLGISWWEDEESLEVWRNNLQHRLAQKQGREAFFKDYRVTVLSSLRTYSPDDRDQAPEDSNEYFGLD